MCMCLYIHGAYVIAAIQFYVADFVLEWVGDDKASFAATAGPGVARWVSFPTHAGPGETRCGGKHSSLHVSSVHICTHSNHVLCACNMYIEISTYIDICMYVYTSCVYISIRMFSRLSAYLQMFRYVQSRAASIRQHASMCVYVYICMHILYASVE